VAGKTRQHPLPFKKNPRRPKRKRHEPTTQEITVPRENFNKKKKKRKRKIHLPHQTTSSVPKISSNSTLQPRSTFSKRGRKIVDVISRRDTKLADKVLGRGLEVAVVLLGLGLRAAKVGVGRDGGGTLEALEASLGFGLHGGVVGTLAEEFVGGDALLVAKLLAGVVRFVICRGGIVSKRPKASFLVSK